MARQKPLVCQHLENISGQALEKYQYIIRQYVGQRHGVYALYRRAKLYYSGLLSFRGSAHRACLGRCRSRKLPARPMPAA